MRPILFQIGDIGVPAFFFMVMVGTLVATFYGYYLSKREKADPVVTLDFGIIGIICAVVGARVFHILIENPAYYLEKPIRVFYFWQGGFVSIGSFVFVTAGIIIYLYVRKLEAWRYLDITATALPAAIFFVRLGCLCAGCCYGKPTDFFINITFNDAGSAAGHYHLGVPLHASQPYFMISAVIMGLLMYWVYQHKKFHGQVVALLFMYYGVSRFFIEFLRGDEDRGLYFGDSISTGQISMIAFFCAGVVIYLLRRKKRLSEGL